MYLPTCTLQSLIIDMQIMSHDTFFMQCYIMICVNCDFKLQKGEERSVHFIYVS